MTATGQFLELREHTVYLTGEECAALYAIFHKQYAWVPTDLTRGYDGNAVCLIQRLVDTDAMSMAHLWSARAVLDMTTKVNRTRATHEGDFEPVTMTGRQRFALCDSLTRLLETAASLANLDVEVQEYTTFDQKLLGDLYGILRQHAPSRSGETIHAPEASGQAEPKTCEPKCPPIRRKLVRKDVKEFRPFDKVLVRNIEKTVWYPSFFGILGCKSKNYMTTSGMFYNDCIPFEGNEWAVGRCTDENDMEIL